MKTIKLILSILSAIASAWFAFHAVDMMACYLMLVALFFILLPEA